MLQGLGLFAELTPESPIIAAILEGRDADAIVECERLAEEAKVLHAAYLAEHPKLASLRQRVVREEGSRGYGAWLEWVDDQESQRRPYGEPPLPVPELRELAWFEGELTPLARAAYDWAEAARLARRFNVVRGPKL